MDESKSSSKAVNVVTNGEKACSEEKKENKGKPRHIETIIGGAPRENAYVKWDDEKEDCIIDDRP